MHPILTIATRAARAAAKVITRSMEQLDTIKISQKGRNDYVTEVDERAEREIIKTIHTAYPNHSILGEESGTISGIDGDENLWIIDPLDGTTNYLHGIPHFSISIALQQKGRLEVALVYQPVTDELFTAVRGRGAQLNSRRLRVAGQQQLDSTIIGLGFPFRGQQELDEYFGQLSRCAQQVAGFRRMGSACLDLAYVAAGRLDGFFELGLNPWDVAAGALLVKEAGGLVCDYRGGENYLHGGEIVAANPKIAKALLQQINSGKK